MVNVPRCCSTRWTRFQAVRLLSTGPVAGDRVSKKRFQQARHGVGYEERASARSRSAGR